MQTPDEKAARRRGLLFGAWVDQQLRTTVPPPSHDASTPVLWLQVVFANHETWAFTGGRTFSDQIMFDDVMVRLVGMFGYPAKVVHGNAAGLDKMAQAWANRMAIDCVAVLAEWDKYGKAAGPVRNEDMLIKHKPKRLIAFPGGRGTADMVRRAKNRRGEIEVVEIKTEPATQSSREG